MKVLLLLHFCQVMLILVFGKLTITVKDLGELIGDTCFASVRLAGKLQVCLLCY